MRYDIDNINTILVGSTQPILDMVVSDETGAKRGVVMLCSRDTNDSVMDGITPSNQFSMKLGDDSIVHAMFDIDDVCVKSAIQKTNTESISSDNPSDKFVDIYAPSTNNDIVSIVQNGGFAYTLTKRLHTNPAYKVTNLDIQRSTIQVDQIENTEYRWMIEEQPTNTYLYESISSDIDLSSHFIPNRNFSSVSYNYVFELPLESTITNNYLYGDVWGDIFTCKNSYDWQYSMSLSGNNTLLNSRDYIDINVCGGNLYMCYDDNITYRGAETSSFNVPQTEYKNTGTTFSYKKIEGINSINRFRSNTKHKSNVYSISLYNTGIEQLNTPNNIVLQSLYNKIKLDINNNVRDIADKICPANTELFGVDIY